MNYDAPPKIICTFNLAVPKSRIVKDHHGEEGEETITIVGIDEEGELWGMVEDGDTFDRWISFQPPAYFANPDEEHIDQMGGEWFEAEDADPPTSPPDRDASGGG